MLPRLCSPLSPSRGRVNGRSVSAESHPHRSTPTRELQDRYDVNNFMYGLKGSLPSFLRIARGVASLWC